MSRTRIYKLIHYKRFIFLSAIKTVINAVGFLFSHQVSCISWPNTGRFILFSDVHYDRFYGSSEAASRNIGHAYGCNESNAPLFSMWNCDGRKDLVRSFVVSASLACPDPDFIIFTGDATRHVNPKNYIYNSFDFIHDLLTEYFPNISHFALPQLILGNMDLDDNYLLDVTSLLPCLTDANGALPRPSNSWLYNLSTYLRYKYFASDEEAATFACGGYLSRKMTNGINIIVLNTVIWSSSLKSKYYNDNSLNYSDPFGQHAWLRRELANIRKSRRRAYIIGHIPLEFNAGISKTHLDRYYETILNFSDVVSSQMFGHFHINSVHVAHHLPSHAPPILLIGSISPINGNNPTFSIVTYDRGPSKVPIDLTTYMLDLDGEVHVFENTSVAQFKPMFSSLLQFLGMKNFTNLEVFKLASRLMFSDEVARDWQDWKVAKRHTDYAVCTDMNCRLEEACTIACGSLRELYESCMNKEMVRQSNEQRLLCSLPPSAYGFVEYQSTKRFWEEAIVLLSQIAFSFLLLFSAIIMFRALFQRRPMADFEGSRRLGHANNENMIFID